MPEPESRPGPRRLTLATEITLVLVIKAVALYLIWLAFFSHPSEKQPDAAGVAASLIAPPEPGSGPAQESGHAARPRSR